MKKTMMWPVAAMALAMLAPSWAEAGWVVTKKTDYYMGNYYGKAPSSETARTYFDKGSFRSDEMGDDGWMAVNPSREGMLVVNTRKRLYYEGSFKEWVADMEKLAKALREMVEAPAARPKPVVKKVGSGGAIAGYPTVKYRIFERGKLKKEVWIVPLGKLPSEIRKANEATQKMGEAFKSNDPVAALQAGGMEMQTKEYGEDGKPIVVSTVVSIKKESLSASLFEPPSGFRRVSSWKELEGEDDGDEGEDSGGMGTAPGGSPAVSAPSSVPGGFTPPAMPVMDDDETGEAPESGWGKRPTSDDAADEEAPPTIDDVKEGAKKLLKGIGGFFGK